jgi:hypothetical protein
MRLNWVTGHLGGLSGDGLHLEILGIDWLVRIS